MDVLAQPTHKWPRAARKERWAQVKLSPLTPHRGDRSMCFELRRSKRQSQNRLGQELHALVRSLIRQGRGDERDS